jgi:hypothetical protein
MDIREHHFGPIAVPVEGTEEVRVDVGALVRRLILFEHCTVESIRLKEIPTMVSVFGYRGLMTLIESGAVQIICDAMTAGQIGQTADLNATRARGGPLPLGAYHLAAVSIPKDGIGRDEYVHGALQHVHQAPIKLKEAIRLKRALLARLLTYPDDVGQSAVDDTVHEILGHHPWIWSGIRRVAMERTRLDIGETPDFEVEDLGNDGDFRIVANLTARFGLDEVQEHRLVERAILAAAGVNQRIGYMQSFNGVTGFQDAEVPYFEDKLDFLMRQIDPDVQEQRFERIVTIAGLPSLEPLPAGATIDVDKLLKFREQDECKELRTWLRGIDTQTDQEISERFEAVRPKLAEAVRGKAGRSVRFIVATVAGMIPPAGPIVGPTLGAVDAFLIDKLVGRPGPAVFLSKHYPSIFMAVPSGDG